MEIVALILLATVVALWTLPLLVWLGICRVAAHKCGRRTSVARNTGIGVWIALTVVAVALFSWYEYRTWCVEQPLHDAVFRNNAYAVDELLDRGGNPNGEWEGEHYLAVAAEHGYIQVAQLLLEHGADPNAVSNISGQKFTAQSVARKNGQTQSVRLLKKAGAKE